jgi:multiple sugar transport system permease protein
VANPASTLPVGAVSAPRKFRVDRYAKFIFLGPTVAYLLVLGLFPLLFSLFMLFGQWKRGVVSWVGLANIERMLQQDRFWNSLKLTLVYVALVTIAQLVLGAVVALALQSAIRGKSPLRLLFTLPMLLPPIAVSFTWKMLLDYDYGPVNYVLRNVGLATPRWLGSDKLAMISLVLVDTWQWTPFIALGMLAALESMPADLYEAALVDGATVGSLLRDITLPLITPYVVALVALRSIDAFKVVDTVFVLTGGGPGTATEFLTFYGYVQGYRPFSLGYTAAVAWSLVVIMTLVFLVFLRVFRRIDETPGVAR